MAYRTSQMQTNMKKYYENFNLGKKKCVFCDEDAVYKRKQTVFIAYVCKKHKYRQLIDAPFKLFEI